MAIYGHRYTLEFSSEDATTDFRLELHQDGYTYGVEPKLKGTDDPIQLSYAPEEDADSPNWTIALSELSVAVNDKAGRLSALSGIEEKEVIAYLYANETLIFEGYVVPGQYVYDRHLDSVAQISCVRGESFMRTRLYRSLAGVNFTGLVSPLEIIRNCFLLSGNTGWISTGMYWIPRLTNNLDAAHDPLRRLRVDQGEFVDEEGNPIVCWDVLQIILRQYQLQLWNDSDSWFVGQRRRVVDEVNNEYEVFIHTDLSTQVALDIPYALDIWNDDRTTLRGYTISHTRPYKYAGAIYNHLGPEAGVLRFGGFEQTGFTDADILKTALSPPGTTDVWIVSADMAGITISPPGAEFTIQTGPRAGARVASAKSLSIPAEYAAVAYDYTDDADNGDMEDLRDLFATLPYAFQETSGFIEGGTDVSLILRANVAMNWASTVAQTTEVFFCLRVKIGDYWLIPSGSAGIYSFSETPTNNDHYLVHRIEYIGFDWKTLVLQTDVLDDSGTPITGPLYVELIAGVEANNPIGQLSTNSRWDDVSFELIDADGNPENQATQSTAVYSASANTYGPEAAVLLFGDGPTSGHKRRQQIQDGTGSIVDVTGNWQVGRTFTGDDSGEYHVGFWAKELLKQHQIPLLRADFEIQLHGELIDVLNPSAAFRDRRVLKLAADVSMGATSITVIPDPAIDPQKYGVIQTKRLVTIDGTEVAKVLHAKLTTEATNTWTLYLAEALAAGYSTGDSVEQVVDFTWNSWRYSCRKNRVQISAIELLAGDEPDVTCSYDVKPGSLQTTSLTDLVGVPCAEEITPVFVPPDAEAGTLFFTTSTSSNSEITANSLMRRATDGTLSVLYTFTGTEPSSLCIDPIERWVFVVQGQNIWRMRYDGSDPSIIYTHSGNTVYGIDFMPTGTYEGYVFYTTGTTGNDNERLHRVDRNGDNQSNVGNTWTGFGPNLVIISSTTIFLSAGFSNASVISMPAAGGFYSVIYAGLWFNSIGIAVDVAGDRIWGTSNSSLEQTNFDGDPDTTVGSINNGSRPWWDATGARLFYGGNGLRYVSGGALGTQVLLSPLTASGGNYDVNQIVAVQ